MNAFVIFNVVLGAIIIYGCVCLVYYLIQEKFLFVPIHTDEFKRRKIRLPFEEVIIDTPHEGIIHGLLFRHTSPKGVVFYLHGNTGSIKRWRYMAEDICKLGFDVFVMDYRGYGDSRGHRSEAILHRDVEVCYEHVMREVRIPKIIYGRSLGCAFAIRLAAHTTPDKLVLETPFNNMVETARSHLPFLPVQWLLRYRFRSDICIKQVRCPIHIFHGTADLIVPLALADKLYQSAKQQGCNVAMTIIPGGRHSNLWKFRPFRTRLIQFMNDPQNVDCKH